MKPGDIVFVKKGVHQLVGRGIVSSDYEFDGDRQDEYKNVRKVIGPIMASGRILDRRQ